MTPLAPVCAGSPDGTFGNGSCFPQQDGNQAQNGSGQPNAELADEWCTSVLSKSEAMIANLSAPHRATQPTALEPIWMACCRSIAPERSAMASEGRLST